MKSFKCTYAVIVKREDFPRIFLSDDGKHFTTLDKRTAAQLVPDFGNLNEAAQRKRLIKALDELDYVGSIAINPRIAPARKKVCDKHGVKRPATVDELHRGALALLAPVNLFDSPRSGCLLLASALTGLRMSSLQVIEPELRSVLEVKSQDKQLMQIIRKLVGIFVQRRKKQSGKFLCKRITVACSDDDSPFDGPASACTFKVQKRGLKAIYGDLPLVDGLLVLADKHVSRKLIESASASTVWTVGFSASCDCAVPLPKSELKSWNPDVIDSLLIEKSYIGALLRRWWDDADIAWATQVIGLVDKTVCNNGPFTPLNKVDSEYVLRMWGYSALSFLDYLVNNGILTADEAAPFRIVFTAVFFPAPPTEEAVQRDALSPEVFLDSVRLMVEEKPERIVEIGAAKTSSRSRVLGEWRIISGAKYLALIEAEFEKIYPGYAKRLGANVAELRDDGWLLKLLKRLCAEEIIKKPSSGYRYRIDKGSNNTYVLAVCAELIGGKTGGNGTEVPLPANLPDFEGDEMPETIATQGVKENGKDEKQR